MPKFRDRDDFKQIEVEAALCAWEDMCERRDSALLRPHFEHLGSAAMRMVSQQAGYIAMQVYDLMETRGFEYIGAYDWEFVPAVLNRLNWTLLCEDNQYAGPPYEPDLDVILDDMMATMGDFSDSWLENAKREAKKQWKYEALVTDHEDKIDRTETPAAWVKRIGEKYDLTPVGGYW